MPNLSKKEEMIKFVRDLLVRHGFLEMVTNRGIALLMVVEKSVRIGVYPYLRVVFK